MEGEGIIIVEELFSSELDFLSENLKFLVGVFFVKSLVSLSQAAN